MYYQCASLGSQGDPLDRAERLGLQPSSNTDPLDAAAAAQLSWLQNRLLSTARAEIVLIRGDDWFCLFESGRRLLALIGLFLEQK